MFEGTNPEEARKELRKPLHEEDKLQAACVKWFNENYRHEHNRMLFHVDNNSWNAIIGAKKKALGVIDGPSDLVLITEYNVSFLEAKTSTGEQSEGQIDFMSKVIERGHEYYIFRTIERFKEIVRAKLG